MEEDICNLLRLTETTERFNPSLGSFAFAGIDCSLTTPYADLLIMRRFNNVRDVSARVHLQKSNKRIPNFNAEILSVGY